MDNSNTRSNGSRHDEHLGVNKMGKNIRKSPLHQPNFPNNNGASTASSVSSASNSGSNAARQQPQPRVYNISKNDFRNVVQQLTGSPSRDSLPRPLNNSPKPPSMRLQKIRPPPLASMNRPRHIYPPINAPAPMPPPLQQVLGPVPGPNQAHYNNNSDYPRPVQGPNQAHYNNNSGYPRPMQGPNQAHYNNNSGYSRPVQNAGQGQPSPTPLTPGNALWANAADSPVSAYMRYLQNSMMDSGPRYPPHASQQFQPQGPGPVQYQQSLPPPQTSSSAGLLPNPSSGLLPNPSSGLLPNPSSGLLPNPSSGLLPSPRMNFPSSFPSPTSQFLLPSPGFFNLSPRSPYPLLSPGIQHPQPMTPNFPFSSIPQSGILGPGPQPPPLSPGIAFPLSPSWFFPMSSPRWRN